MTSDIFQQNIINILNIYANVDDHPNLYGIGIIERDTKNYYGLFELQYIRDIAQGIFSDEGVSFYEHYHRMYHDSDEDMMLYTPKLFIGLVTDELEYSMIGTMSEYGSINYLKSFAAALAEEDKYRLGVFSIPEMSSQVLLSSESEVYTKYFYCNNKALQLRLVWAVDKFQLTDVVNT